MADTRTPDSGRPSGDRGFTLVEVMIVMGMIGILAAAIAISIITVLRTSPATEVRVDDARSVQGLVTWLPQDVDATPHDGFNRDTSYWPCGGSAPSNSFNVLTAEWTEKTGVTHNFAASYRYENRGGTWSMTRYACDNGGSGPMGTPERVNLTSELPPWNAMSPPARVVMCSSQVSAGGSCPVADVIPTAVATPTSVESLKLELTYLDGSIATIDAAPKNPDQDLADDPNATTNHPPVVSQTNYVLDMFAGDTVTIDIGVTHNAADPDADPISVAIDSTEPMPAGITASTSDPLDLTVTAAAGLPAGTLSPKIVTIVSDNKAGWVDATVTVRIIPEPNLAPTLTSLNYHLLIEQGETLVLPLDVTHGVTDPNGDPVTATVMSYPNSRINPPKLNVPGPLDLEVKTGPSATLGPTLIPITLQFSDGKGGFAVGTITVEIVTPSVNQPPTASPTNIDVDLYSPDTLTLDLTTSHGVTDPDGDPLSVTSATGPVGVTTTAVGLNVTIDTAGGLPTGPLGTPVTLVVADVSGASVTVTVTINIVPTPAPPADCVLGTLTASPSSVVRNGGGPSARLLRDDVTVTITYSGSCDGLALFYDTGDTSGLGIGTGRIFPPGSPSSVVIVSKNNGGTEKWTPGVKTLTASTTSDVTPNSISTTLTVS